MNKVLNQDQKDNLSKIMTAKWKKAEKYSEILNRPKEEVFQNLDLINKYSKQLRGKAPYYIALVLKQGKWSQPFENGKDAILNEDTLEELAGRSSIVKVELVTEALEERLKESKETKKEAKKDDNDPFADMKVMFWTIKKIGSMERAEKMLQACKLALGTINNEST